MMEGDEEGSQKFSKYTIKLQAPEDWSDKKESEFKYSRLTQLEPTKSSPVGQESGQDDICQLHRRRHEHADHAAHQHQKHERHAQRAARQVHSADSGGKMATC